MAWAANRRPASQVVVLVNPPTDDHCIYSNTIHNTVPPPQLVAWVTAAATTITTTATTTAAAPPPPPSLLLQRHHPSSSVDPLWDPENHPFSAKKRLGPWSGHAGGVEGTGLASAVSKAAANHAEAQLQGDRKLCHSDPLCQTFFRTHTLGRLAH